MHCRLLLIVTVCGMIVSPLRAEVVLVREGKAVAVIHASERVLAADDVNLPRLRGPQREAELQRQRLRESVKDLAAYLQKISGAVVAVRTGPPAENVQQLPLLVGELGEKVFGAPKKTAPFKQGFRLVASNKSVGLYGESDLASSYAVYELLDRLGCRWYMPGELGEVIPQTKTIALAEMDFSSAPGTTYRGIWYADEAYKRRNRHGGLLLSAGHALEHYVTKEQRLQHPEWQAEINGKPHPIRLKWSNPNVANAIAARINELADVERAPSYSLSPEDGAEFDESADDKAIDATDYDTTVQTTSITDRLMVLTNRVAAQVTRRHPDALFGVLAYVQYTRPPVREKVHPSVVPQIAPITYSRSHPMNDDRVPGNKDLRYLVQGWGKAARQTSVYFYGYYLAETSAPQPMLAKWGHDVPFVLQNNCKFWQPETIPNFETHLHALYMSCRLAWDPSLKPDAVYDEINSRFYGAAAKEMAAYWQYLDEVWVTSSEFSGCGFGYLRRWTPERLTRARQLMEAAKAACRTDVEKRRVEIADESLGQFELFMKLRRDQAEGRFDGLADDAALWRKRAVELGEKHQKEFAFSKVGWTPHTIGGTYFASFYQKTYDDATRIAKGYQILTPKPLREWRWQPDEKDGRAGKQTWMKPDFDDRKWKTTDPCVETWSTLGLHDWFKSVWYRTTVKVPVTVESKKTYLWIGATDGSVKVYVNGKLVPFTDAKGVTSDEFNGYCQPASFDVTSMLKPGAENQITLFCTRTFFNELGTGGLIGPVVLYAER